MAVICIDKKKMCTYLALVVAGLLCVVLMVYALFFAKPHVDPTIKNAPHAHSTLRLPDHAIDAASPAA